VPRLRRTAGAAALALVLGAAVAACGGDGDDGGDEASDGTATTALPEFEGDPDSAFCEASRAAADEPVLDPFAAGLDPAEVETRFEALAGRFDRFAELAPEALAADLALLDERLDRLAGVLADAGYDFERLVGAGEDLTVFDDPALADVAARLAAYQEQVCTR